MSDNAAGTTGIADVTDTARYALDALTKAGAGKAACRTYRRRKDEFNVEAEGFTLLRTVFSDRLSLTAIKDGRKGETVVNGFDRDTVDAAVAECMALAAVAEPDEAHDVAGKGENKHFARGIGEPDMDALFSRTKELTETLAGEYPGIKVNGIITEFNGGACAYVNSRGAAFTEETGFYEFENWFSAVAGGKSSSFNSCYAALSSLDRPFIDLDMHRTLLAESVRSLDARVLEGKFVGKIIVTPACRDMIWQTILGCFLSDAPLIEGTSLWKDALGTAVADPRLTFGTSPLNRLFARGERVTDDGFESRDLSFIKNGVLESFALSLYGANKTGKKPAANTAFENIEVAAGYVPLAEIIAGVERGILVNRFSGAAPGPSGDVSGIAKNSFLIEGGRVTDPLKETMISFNLPEALRSISGISSERACDGVTLLPWCCFDGITISGK